MITLDWNKYTEKARQTAAEGIVMLENNGVLPLDREKETALFGRMQLHYYKSGTGSGGLVNAPVVTGILDGLLEAGAVLNKELLDIYRKWDEENPIKLASGWGGEPWSQEEMPVDKALADRIAKTSDTAVCIIARTAGEEQENSKTPGSYFLTDAEESMLRTVRDSFRKMVVLLNTGNIIDMSFVKKYSPDAVLYVWHGGMTGGLGVADVLLGVSPSGKLPDTIPVKIEDCPSDSNFGDPKQAVYAEDIYVGYRYFETMAQDKVLYPFGYGMSYTTFSGGLEAFCVGDDGFDIAVSVTNTGSVSGKEVVQIYVSAPQGKLGKPARVLCAFEKTPVLAPSEKTVLNFSVPFEAFASYDDTGRSGYMSAFVLESGTYVVYAGSDVRSAVKAAEFEIEKTICIEQLSQALAPVTPFKRLKADGSYEDTPLQRTTEEEHRRAELSAGLEITGDKGLKLADVYEKCTMDEFIAQLTKEELCSLARGEGMGSPKVTAGTASAFGGLTKSLAAYGIPAGCCSDGPSGIRFDCGTQACSLPIGTLIASTFNKELVTELFTFVGNELAYNNIDCLLGPGMNIHRHPLNGRNFEYFSEDPYLTGYMAAAELKGLHRGGAEGTIKHFCGNNQEHGRHTIDSVVSERALREIYLKGFETAVKHGARSVMTTYGKVNGLYTAGSFDLCTVILRDQWHFDGFVMTDWWANINRRGGEATGGWDLASMSRAHNDVYMCTPDALTNRDSLPESIENGYITVGELQRNAASVCGFLRGSRAMARLLGSEEKIDLINRTEVNDADVGELDTYELSDNSSVSTDFATDRGSEHYMLLGVDPAGKFEMSVTASAEGGKLAQIPMTIFSMGTPIKTLTWNGTDGEDVTFTADIFFFSRDTTVKLFFAQSGLHIKSITFTRCESRDNTAQTGELIAPEN